MLSGLHHRSNTFFLFLAEKKKAVPKKEKGKELKSTLEACQGPAKQGLSFPPGETGERSHRESNPDRQLRKLKSYPLDDGSTPFLFVWPKEKLYQKKKT